MKTARVSCFASAAWRPSVLSKYLPTLVVAALALAALPRAHATQTITLNSSIDTYIQMGEAVDHQAETTPLHVRGGASQQRLTYLKFTVPFSAAASGGGNHDIAAGNMINGPYKIVLQVYKNTTTPASGVTPSCVISLHPVSNGWWQPTARGTAVANFDGAHYGSVVPVPLSTPIASLNSLDGTLPSGVGYITFDVTSYVTGPGDYSFCLQTTSTTDIGFKSHDGTANPTNPPKLVFTVGSTLAEDREYFRRYPTEVLAAGSAIISRYLAFNSATTPTGDDDVNKFGYIDATKQPYNLKGGGDTNDATDNYFALQRAVNEARDARCAVYIPPGRYVIDNQIQLIQGLVPYEGSYGNTFGERWDINDFPCVLIGYGNDPSQRSTLILKSNSNGFTSSAAPKPMLYFWSRWNNYTGPNVNTPPTWNRLASHFDATLANIDLELNSATTGTLNAGAIGVDMGGAQGTSIHDVNVKATNAFAGFRALPGPGGLTHSVSVTDGAYGLYCVGDATSGPGQNIGADTAISTVVAASTFTNQSSNAVYWQGLQGLVLVGCDIVSPLTGTGTAPVWVNGINTANRLQGNVTIVESRISRAGAGPLVKGNRSVYLRDVYGNLANPVVDVENVTESGRVPPAGYSTGWTWVQECWDGVIIDQNADSAGAAYVKTRIAGQADSQRNILKKQVALTDIPADLLSRHVPTATPRWDQSGVINIKTDYGAVGDGSDNGDGAKIQAALDHAGALAEGGTPAYVFIPRGDFYVEAQGTNSGLVIPNNVVVFGIDKSYSRIKAQPEIVGPLLTAGEGDARDRGARTMLADLMLLQKMGPSTYNDNSLLKWQVGRHSVVRNVNFDRRNSGTPATNTEPLVLITGNGGGRWYDFWNDSDAGQGSTYRHIKIDGTSEPLKIYMLNAETDTDLPQAEIVNASNVQVFQTKWEGDAVVNGVTKRINQPVLDITNSTDISVFGFSGNAELDDDGSSPLNADDYVVKINSGDRLLAAQNNFQKSTADEDHYGWFRDAGPTTITTPHNEQFVLYRRNNPRRFALITGEGANTDGWMLGPVAGPASSFGATGGGSLSLRVGDDGAATPKQYRSILSFDVRQIPDGATIHSMKLRLRVGDVPANLAAIDDVILEIRQNSTDAENIFGTSSDLQNADFAGPTSAPAAVTVATIPVTTVMPYQVLEITIPSSFHNYVKPSGVGRTRVQFRIKPSASPGAGTADILGFYAGDTNNMDYKPVLEIVYTP